MAFNGQIHTSHGIPHVKMKSVEMLLSKKFAEFFAGIGLMRMGLEQAGWKIAFANDIDPVKYQLYAHHFSDAGQHFILGDIHSLPGASVPSVALATASFPCNDLSLAGMREGLGGKHSSAYWGFIRILREMGSRKPPIVLVENVAGFLTSHKGNDLAAALEALNSLGYVVDVFILDAVNFVPQSRIRVFIVGSTLINKTEICVKSPHFYESEVRPRAIAEFIYSHPEIIWRIRNLPKLPTRKAKLVNILEDLPDDSPLWWKSARTDYLLAQMSPKHKDQLRGMMNERSWSYGTVFRRVRQGRSMAELRIDGIAGCLRTPRGGSGRQILLRAGHGSVMARLITPRECAKLMGADDFQIETSLNKALFGFGDAVCVPAVRWIAENYLDPLVNEMIQKTEGQFSRPRTIAADIR